MMKLLTSNALLIGLLLWVSVVWDFTLVDGFEITLDRRSTLMKRGITGLKNNPKIAVWSASVFVGTSPQPINLTPDTGSSNFFVTSQTCQSIPSCKEVFDGTFYKEKESSSFKSIGADSYTFNFGDGAAFIYFPARDQVNFGGQMVLKNHGISTTTDIKSGPTDNDGILGLGRDGILRPDGLGIQTTLTAMVDQGLIPKPLFSLNLLRTGPSGGEINFGSYDVSKIKTDTLVWLPLTSANLWEAHVDNFFVGQISLQAGGNFVFDSGTTLILAPCSIISRIYDNIPSSVFDPSGFWLLPCDLRDPKYDVILQLGKRNFTIPIKEFIDEPFPGTNLCLGGAQSSDEFYLLGAPFLKLYTIIFDEGLKRIGVAYRA